MNSYAQLPEGYREVLHIDLQKDSKLMLIINGMALVIMVVMLGISACFVPFTAFFDYGDYSDFVLRMVVMCVLLVLYIVLHEAVHGIFMRRYCTAKVRFGFTGMYAYAGSDGYYCRKDYIKIALAPIVIWGVVLLIANFFVNEAWFYVVYFIQVSNISGAAGDLYVSWKMSKLPKDILVNDTGVAMTVFSREG